MNVFSDNSLLKKRLKNAGILLTVFIILVGLIFIIPKLKGDKKDGADGAGGEQASTGYPINDWQARGDIIDGDFDETGGSEVADIVIPTTTYGGTVVSYEDYSTYAELKLYIGGDVEREASFRLVPTGIVFDATNNRVIKPSELRSGSKTRVLALGDSREGMETVEVVIVNDKENIHYTPITKIDKETKEFTFYNDMTQRKYTMEKDARLINALSGFEVEKEDLKISDRLFIYGERVNNENNDDESDTKQKGDEVKDKLEFDAGGIVDFDGIEELGGGQSFYDEYKVDELYVYPSK